MELIFSILLLINPSEFPTPVTGTDIYTNADFSCRNILQPYVFLSGITWDTQGYILCDYKGNRIIRITEPGKAETIVEKVETPVDVEYVGDSLWILLHNPKKLISWNPKTNEFIVLFDDFSPESNLTAFAVSSKNLVYVVDFTGTVYQIDLIKKTKSILLSNLDNPADIAVLPQGGFAVTEQVGSDMQGGRVDFYLTDGQVQIYNLIDPTGLAVGADGCIYVSVFSTGKEIPPPNREPNTSGSVPISTSMGGIYRIKTPGTEPELIIRGLSGPTSLTIRDNNDIAVIEESNNAIVSISAAYERTTLFQGTITPIATRSFPDRTLVYLSFTNNRYEVALENGQSIGMIIWTTSNPNPALPQFEIGGDSMLYIYDPNFQEIQVFDSWGKIRNIFFVDPGKNQPTKLISDPKGGVALVQWETPVEWITVQRVNQNQVSPAEKYPGDYSSLLYFDASGVLQDVQKEIPVPGTGTTEAQIVVNSNGDIWYLDPTNGNIYIRNNNSIELVVGGLGAVQDIASDGSTGLNVTTQDGNVYHVTPRTPVTGWILY